MALAGRSARRAGAGLRWLAVGVVLTLVILLIDASLHSKSPDQGVQLAAGKWIDRILPIVTTSTVEGQVISQIWASGLTTQAPQIASQLQQVVNGSAQASDDELRLH